MKKFSFLIIALVFALLAGCTPAAPADPDAPAAPAEYDLSQANPKTFKMLIIGHSNTKLSTTYLPQIAADLGTELVLGTAWRGDSTLGMLVQVAYQDSLLYDKGSEVVSNGQVNSNLLDALSDEEWDAISFFQGVASYDPMGTAKSVPAMVRLARGSNEDVPLYHFMSNVFLGHSTYDRFINAYNGDSQVMFDRTVEDVKTNVITNEDITALVPGMTLVASLYTHPAYKDKMYVADGVHMSDYATYACSMLWYAALTHSSVEQVQFVPAGIGADFRDQVKALIPRVLNHPYTVVDLSQA